MPGVQCVICLSSDTSTDEWCSLRECGHVFHTHCLVQSLEHNRRCPQCRMDYGGRKWSGGKQPYQRIFFEFSDEPLSQPAGGAGGSSGGGGADLAQVAFLQGQLRDKDRRLQTMATQLVETEDKAAQLQADLGLARSALRDKEAKLQEKIGEWSREHKQVKLLANQVANLTSQLKTQTGHAALLNLTTDHTLIGPALGAEVRKLVQLGMKAPNDFWERLMSERNSIIASNNNRHAKERAVLERQQEKLQAEVARLQAEVAGLKRSLAAARQGLPGGAAALADAAFEAAQQRAPAGPRHALRRFGGGGAGTSAAGASSSAAEDEDPLLQSYDLLDSMRVADLPAARPRQPGSQQQAQQAQQTQQAQQLKGAPRQQQDRQPAAGAADAAAAAAAGSENEDEIVLLDGSEEQWQEEDAEDEEAEVCLSEEDEPDAQQQQQPRPQQTAAPPPAMQQQQQQHSQAAGSSLLGKRQGAAAIGLDENCPGGTGGGGAALLPLAAGPARAALHRGPGTTFIRNTSAASLGIDRGRYISSGPDGKGGVATAYQSGKSGGGGAVRLAQRQLDLPALHQAGGAKKARSGGGSQSSMGSADAAAAAALRRNNALPITSFFSKAPSGGRQ